MKKTLAIILSITLILGSLTAHAATSGEDNGGDTGENPWGELLTTTPPAPPETTTADPNAPKLLDMIACQTADGWYENGGYSYYIGNSSGGSTAQMGVDATNLDHIQIQQLSSNWTDAWSLQLKKVVDGLIPNEVYSITWDMYATSDAGIYMVSNSINQTKLTMGKNIIEIIAVADENGTVEFSMGLGWIETSVVLDFSNPIVKDSEGNIVYPKVEEPQTTTVSTEATEPDSTTSENESSSESDIPTSSNESLSTTESITSGGESSLVTTTPEKESSSNNSSSESNDNSTTVDSGNSSENESDMTTTAIDPESSSMNQFETTTNAEKSGETIVADTVKRPKKTKIKKAIRRASLKKIKIKIKKVKGATGYRIQFSKNKKFKKVLAKKIVKTAKVTIKSKKINNKLKKAKKLFVRVRAYRLDGDKKVWAKKWSKPKKVKKKK